MEWIEIIQRTDDYIKMRYYPNQDKAAGLFGEVTYFFVSDKWIFNKIVEDYPASYAMHAVNFARYRHKANEEIPQSGLVAWH